MKFFFRALDFLRVPRIHRTSQTKFAVVGHRERFVEILRFRHRQHWPKNFFLKNPRFAVNVRDHSGLDKISVTARVFSSGHQTPFLLSLVDVAQN